jgi:DNA-binding NtrC family response regulator
MNRLRILLIEDHLGERLNIMKVLSLFGVEVETVVTFNRARDLFQKRNYNLVISELQLGHCPESQGDGTQFWMYSQKINPQVPMALLSADAPRLTAELLKFGHVIPSVLAKPIRPDVLQTWVEARLHGAKILSA